MYNTTIFLELRQFTIGLLVVSILLPSGFSAVAMAGEDQPKPKAGVEKGTLDDVRQIVDLARDIRDLIKSVPAGDLNKAAGRDKSAAGGEKSAFSVDEIREFIGLARDVRDLVKDIPKSTKSVSVPDLSGLLTYVGPIYDAVKATPDAGGDKIGLADVAAAVALAREIRDLTKSAPAAKSGDKIVGIDDLAAAVAIASEVHNLFESLPIDVTKKFILPENEKVNSVQTSSNQPSTPESQKPSVKRTTITSSAEAVSETHRSVAQGDPLKSGDVGTVVEGNTRFAIDLYSYLRRGEKAENLFFSPLSLSSALAMTYAGASGTTESQMAKVLHLMLTKEKLNPAFASLNRTLIAGDQQLGLDLKVANRLWAQEGATFLPAFLTATRDYYGAEVGQVDFVGQTEEARIAINTWVEKQTLSHIKDLILTGDVTPDTRLVLTNAIYFKGNWDSQFSKDDTKEAAFTLKDNRIVEVPLMRQQGLFPYFDSGTFQVLGLPYKGGSLSLVILLPKKADGLNDVEKSFTEEKLAGCISKMKIENVVVMIPRFKVELSFKLKEALSAMGMPIAFHQGAANFSGMNCQDNLFISDVLHKSFLEVNEEGSKATGATAVVMEEKSVPKEPSIFHADHPFLFLIRDNRTGSLLFLGRLVNPQK